jgi:hypothetical protein
MLRLPLLNAIEFAAKASGRTGCPETETVLLESSNGLGTATGTNLELFMRSSFLCDIDLSCCVPSRRLKTVLSLCPDESINLEYADQCLTILGDGFRQVIQCLPPDGFPRMFTVEGEDFPIPSAAIKKCIPAASTDGSKYIFQSVYLDSTGVVIAANGKGFHCVEGLTIPRNGIVPIGAAHLLASMEGEMRLSDKFFAASSGDDGSLQVSGKLIEGQYIDWRKAVREPENEVEVPFGLQESIARAVGCASNATLSRAIFEDGEVSLPDSVVACGLDTGFKFAMNPDALCAALKAAGDGAKIGFTSPVLPFRIRNGSFTAYTTPQRTEL